MGIIEEKEAELVGIILGDGHLDIHTYGIIITCGEIDWNYIHKYVPKLMEDIFLKRPCIVHIKYKGFAIQCKLYSKEAFYYIKEKYNIKSGKKKNMEIPKEFFKDKNLLRACVKGMMDTDGGIYRHHARSIQIVFYNSDILLISSLKKAFNLLGYNPKISREKRGRFHLDLFTEDSKKYYDEIGFSNAKNNIKFKQWLKDGRIPNNSEIKKEIAVAEIRIPDLNGFSGQSLGKALYWSYNENNTYTLTTILPPQQI